MPRQTEDSMRKIYKLWFEFLLLSNNYKDFCEWKRKEKRNASVERPEMFKKLDILLPFVVGYSNFGDIFEIDFEKWWANRKEFLLARRRVSVSNFINLFKTEMENAIAEFKLDEGRDPSLNEFQGIILGLIDSPKRDIISVTLTGGETVKDLSLQFAKLIRRSKSKFKANHWRSIGKLPTTTKRIDELQRYLDVYKLSLQGRSPREIAGQIEYYSRHKSDAQERHRMIRSDRQKAKSIIKNVEQGIFPGKY